MQFISTILVVSCTCFVYDRWSPEKTLAALGFQLIAALGSILTLFTYNNSIKVMVTTTQIVYKIQGMLHVFQETIKIIP